MKLAVFSIKRSRLYQLLELGPELHAMHHGSSYTMFILDGHTQHFIEIMLLVNQIKVKSVCMKS